MFYAIAFLKLIARGRQNRMRWIFASVPDVDSYRLFYRNTSSIVFPSAFFHVVHAFTLRPAAKRPA